MNIKNVIVICFLMSAKICITSATSISNELVLIPQAYELCEKIEELVHKHQLPELQSRVRILKNKFDDYHKTVLPVLKAALDCSKTNDEALILLRNPRTILAQQFINDLYKIADDALAIVYSASNCATSKDMDKESEYIHEGLKRIHNELVGIKEANGFIERLERIVCERKLSALQLRFEVTKNKFDDYHKTVLPILQAALDGSKEKVDEALILLRNPRAILSIHLVRDLHTIADDIQKAGRVPFSIADIVKEQRQLMGS
ncbi:hypothetical protein KAZ82_00535 [Candidatus Babeliales bacterium]|nr:hypothetical protein [Candidatus Babeliales bacterium]